MKLHTKRRDHGLETDNWRDGFRFCPAAATVVALTINTERQRAVKLVQVLNPRGELVYINPQAIACFWEHDVQKDGHTVTAVVFRDAPGEKVRFLVSPEDFAQAWEIAMNASL